jgi:hypothetical protein
MGYYFYLHLEKKKIRKEVKEGILGGLSDSKLVKFELTEAQANLYFTWIHSREFKFKERLYDIVRQSVVGDTLIYWCWPDDQETQIEDRINTLVKRTLAHEHQDKENRQSLTKIFKLVFIANEQHWNGTTSYKFNNHTYEYPQQKIHAFYISPPVPPPQCG